MRNLLRRKGGPNAPAATPQIDINFSRREGATTWGEGVRRGCEKVRRAPTKVPPICDVAHSGLLRHKGTFFPS